MEEELEGYKRVGNQERIEWIENQMKYVKDFLPQMMSKEEIEKIIISLPDKSVPAVMKHFKSQYAGKCEMRTVQEVLKHLS